MPATNDGLAGIFLRARGAKVGECPPSQRQSVAAARAVAFGSKVAIMDEPDGRAVSEAVALMTGALEAPAEERVH